MPSDESCIFCKVVKKEIPAGIVKETEDSIAFRDINPQAPVHILVVPKVHVANVAAVEDADHLGNLFQTACRIAAEEGLDDGFRLVVNKGEKGGQTVDHLHIHLLGGRQLNWPPG